MSPNEFNVLMVFEKADTAGKGRVSKRLGISTDYAEYLCKSLFRKGYLEALPGGRYRLTQKGLSVLFEYLSRIRDELKRKLMFYDERMEMTRLRLAKLRRMEGTFQE